MQLDIKDKANSESAEVNRLKKLIEYDRRSRRRMKDLVVDIVKSLEQKVKLLLFENYNLKRAKHS